MVRQPMSSRSLRQASTAYSILEFRDKGSGLRVWGFGFRVFVLLESPFSGGTSAFSRRETNMDDLPLQLQDLPTPHHHATMPTGLGFRPWDLGRLGLQGSAMY